ncbi:hypothetical protein [Chitinophaga varians]|uniref:hypothetical protein n=1 Tax=Chitinophaga varians TaxID=2202339 RepID=UPI00165F4E59|nr:hypothetical protein [Chitinophaga varians]MBC9909808.1 hypothetical protein [Chitinophaga varians]
MKNSNLFQEQSRKMMSGTPMAMITAGLPDSEAQRSNDGNFKPTGRISVRRLHYIADIKQQVLLERAKKGYHRAWIPTSGWKKNADPANALEALRSLFSTLFRSARILSQIISERKNKTIKINFQLKPDKPLWLPAY